MRLPVESWFGPYFGFVGKLATFYEAVPPFGDLVFDLRHIYFATEESSREIVKLLAEWGCWAVVLMGGLWARILRPARFRSAEM